MSYRDPCSALERDTKVRLVVDNMEYTGSVYFDRHSVGTRLKMHFNIMHGTNRVPQGVIYDALMFIENQTIRDVPHYGFLDGIEGYYGSYAIHEISIGACLQINMHIYKDNAMKELMSNQTDNTVGLEETKEKSGIIDIDYMENKGFKKEYKQVNVRPSMLCEDVVVSKGVRLEDAFVYGTYVM